MSNGAGESGIIRVQHDSDHPYKVLNTSFANDARLSWAARGLLVYLLSKPNDWKMRLSDVVKQSSAGRDAVYAILRNLEDVGYLRRIRSRKPDGTFEYTTIIYEVAQPVTDNPETEDPTEDETFQADEPVADKPLAAPPIADKPDIYRIGKVPTTDLPSIDPPPPPRNARAYRDVGHGDVGSRGGGGGETMEIDDVGDVEDSQGDEAETAHLKADLIDALAALGVRPEMAQKAVMAGTVTSEYDVILCKRFIQSSTANIPAAVLWSQYLSLGRLPPAPYSETSTVTADQLAAARRMREESDRRAEVPGPVVGLAGLGAVLAGPTLRSMPAPLRFPAEARR